MESDISLNIGLLKTWNKKYSILGNFIYSYVQSWKLKVKKLKLKVIKVQSKLLKVKSVKSQKMKIRVKGQDRKVKNRKYKSLFESMGVGRIVEFEISWNRREKIKAKTL